MKILGKLFSKVRSHRKTIKHLLNECCRYRGLPICLIHKTIHEFNWFYQNLIFDKEKIINDSLFPIKDAELIEKIYNYHYAVEWDDTLEKTVRLFHEYCKKVYATLEDALLNDI